MKIKGHKLRLRKVPADYHISFNDRNYYYEVVDVAKNIVLGIVAHAERQDARISRDNVHLGYSSWYYWESHPIEPDGKISEGQFSATTRRDAVERLLDYVLTLDNS